MSLNPVPPGDTEEEKETADACTEEEDHPNTQRIYHPHSQNHHHPENLCQAVRQSCEAWYQHHHQQQATVVVRIHTPALVSLAGDIHTQTDTNQKSQTATASHTKTANTNSNSNTNSNPVQWDEQGWHYHPPSSWPVEIIRERVALYILALDAINFCFWPINQDDGKDKDGNKFEYQHLAMQLTIMAEADHKAQQQTMDDSLLVPGVPVVSDQYALSAYALRTMTVTRMQAALFPVMYPQQPPDLLAQRCALWNEVGTVLLQYYEGSAWTMIQAAQGSAVRAVQLLVQHLVGFGDYCPCPPPLSPPSHGMVQPHGTTSSSSSSNDKDDNDDHDSNHHGRLYFLKRAQICVADWQAALVATTGVEPFFNNDLDQLTCFADYRLPQLLRQRGVLVYVDEHLSAAVDAQIELIPGGRHEVSIRAATVVAVERLVDLLNNNYSGGGAVLEQQQQEEEETDSRAMGQWDATTTTSVPNVKVQWTSMSVDWYLWQMGERLDAAGELAPHHRVRTIYY
jgi:hypothetical protein